MIPYTIDPSLHSAQPEPELLGDGFSPPRAPGDADQLTGAPRCSSLEDALASKSDF